MVPWTIYNGSFTIGCKIDGQKVGSDLSYKSPHVPAELCSRLSKRNKVIAPSGKSKWVRITSFTQESGIEVAPSINIASGKFDKNDKRSPLKCADLCSEI